MNGVTMNLRQSNGVPLTVTYECHNGDVLTSIIEETIRLGAVIENIEVA
jgi:hypothetical protein